ncbi:transcription termination factor Rho [Escherichia coli]|nr:transcription termination factor Rho [Escherichia coli]
MDLVSSVPQTAPTSPVLMTSTFPLAKSAVSTSALVIPSLVRFARRKKVNAIFALLKVNEVNFDKPENARNKILFENLTPLHANSRLRMERGNGSTEDLTARVLDLASPIGRGQRGLIVAPPKAGKTMLLQNIAQSIAYNHPDCVLMVLLIDERPEEVTEMQRLVKGEVVASTFDEPRISPRSGCGNGDREGETPG